MARKEEDSMEHTESTISNAEQTPPQATSASCPDAAEMELLYIWINQDETGFIREQGFNFSPNYRFEMKKTEDGQKYELSCTETPKNYNVWKQKPIVNLTAVVGENGSGKSSLLRHMLRAGLASTKSKKASESVGAMVKVYRCGDSVYVYHNFPLINNTPYPSVDVKKRGKQPYTDTPDKQTRIYISNALTAPSTAQQSRGDRNIIYFSPAGNMELARKFYHKESARNIDRILGLDIASHKSYKDFEQLAAAAYYHALSSAERKSPSFVTPSRRIIIRMIDPACWFPGRYTEVFASRDSKSSRNWHGSFLSSEQYKRWKKEFEHLLVRTPCCALYLSLLFELASVLGKSFPIDSLTHYRIHSLEYEVEALLKQYACEERHRKDALDYFYQALYEVWKLADIIRACLTEFDYVPYTGKEYRTSIIIDRRQNPAAYAQFCEFCDRLMKMDYSFVLKYITIDMPTLSSGEQALQNIFTWLRLPPFYKEILGEESIPIENNVLLLLDEVDLYMHPEWQRKFLKLLSDELNVEYPQKHIQIVISTHSPLVLSDVPSGNIIYLEKNDKKCTISMRPDVGESFGANIFTLLKDSFYLKRPLGEFAHARIEEVIRDLNKLKKNPNDKALRKTCRGYKQLIDIIGEPVIRRKLQNLYADLFDTAPEDGHRRDLAELSRLLESGDPAQREKYRELLKNMLSDIKRS